MTSDAVPDPARSDETDETDETEDETVGDVGRIVMFRRQLGSMSGQRNEVLESYRRRSPIVDLLATLVERDQDAFASVLGSAVALRLFLFLVPALTAVIGLLNVIGLSRLIGKLLSASGTTGRVAKDITDATAQSHRAGLGLLISGLILMLIAGRSLTRVLAASAASGWRLSARDAKPTLKMAGTLTGLVFSLLVLTAAMARIRKEGGFALSTGSLLVLGVVVSIGWFLVSWTLPKPHPDPGAHLPGSVFVGVGMSILQWFMQFYLPSKFARSSETMGSIGVSVVALGYFFFVGRLMTSSFVVNAVFWERYGSVSELAFALPGIRRIPRRWPRVAQFFELAPRAEGTGATAEETPADR